MRDQTGGAAGETGPGPILLVDDEPFMLRWLTWHLTRAGYRVATAPDGAAGLARARALRPPLIFLDARMPRLDGGRAWPGTRRGGRRATPTRRAPAPRRRS